LLQLQEVTENFYNKGQRKLVFRACYDNSIPEHQRFQKATPTGLIELFVDNPSAITQFELGKYYYFDAEAKVETAA
jgi:hypothetical protein